MLQRCPSGRAAARGRSSSVRIAAEAVQPAKGGSIKADRRAALVLGGGLALGAAQQLVDAGAAAAIDGNPFKKELKQRRPKIPIEKYSDGPDGLKYYDLVEGTGAEAKEGQRIAIHYDLKFRNITLATTRVGAGVTGGVPQGFDVGQPPGSPGSIGVKGIDLGVRGMRVGGLRRLIVPPELGYGDKQAGELPPNSTIEIDVELLSIKSKSIL